MSFSLPPTEEKAEYVLQQFDRIAERYDLTNDVISLGMHHAWKERAVKALNLKEGGRYLDVCCGTGDLTLLIGSKLQKGDVTGLDFSSGMLQVAKRRIAKKSAQNATSINFLQGDALNLPFEADQFDGAIVSFGLRNLVNFQQGIDEMTRIVKPGGAVINLDLGRSKVPLFSQFFAFYFRQIVPIIGDLLQSDKKAYTYLPESMNTYPKPDGITEIFANAKLQKIEYVPLALGTVAMHKGIKPSA